MRRDGSVLAAAMLCLSVVAIGADKKTDFSGTWVLDKSQSDAAPGMGRGGRAGSWPGRGGRGGGWPGRGGPRARADRPDRAPDVTLIIKQTDNQLSVTRKFSGDGKGQEMQQTFTLDGSENTNPAAMGRGEFKSTSEWNGEKLVIEGTQTVSTPSGEFEAALREEFSLSGDGKVLTIRTVRSTPRGENSFNQLFRLAPESAK